MLQLCIADMYNEAAENATNAMKGRLASQYYMKAEEAASMVEEWCHTYVPVRMTLHRFFASDVSIVVRWRSTVSEWKKPAGFVLC